MSDPGPDPLPDHSTTPSQVPIAITGLGLLMPGAQSVGEFWRAIVTGRDAIRDVPATHWLIEDYYDPDPAAPDRTYGRRGAFLDPSDFAPLAHGVPPSTLPATDTAQLLALLVAERVLDDATDGDPDRLDRDRTGVVLGTGALELLYSMSNRMQRPIWLKALREHGLAEADAQAVCERIAGSYVPWQEATFPGLLSNVVAGRIANRLDLRGVNHTTDAACASSLAALSTAVNELAVGQADLMVAGGVDTLNDIVMFTCFSKTPALSPTGDCRPFSDRADGTVLGEGLAMLALKRLADAERDGDRVYAVIRGVGTSSDGRGAAIYAPEARGQASALRRAYERAGYGPETVELVEAHGTGTKAGDKAEYSALRTVFAESDSFTPQWCALGSVKSQIGHTKSAAGAAGLVKAALALHQKVLPPTIKVEHPNPEIRPEDPLYVNTEARPWIRGSRHPRRASVSSFGFGGSNFHVTLEEYAPAIGVRAAFRHRVSPSELVLLSADSAETIIRDLKALAERGPLADLARVSQQEFSADRPVRLALVAADDADLAEKARRVTVAVQAAPDSEFSWPGGVHYRPTPGTATTGKLALLFPGQGSQYVGMGADLAMHLPQARAVWDRAADLALGDRPLHRVVFPPPAFTDDERREARRMLDSTEWTQPALAAQSMALTAVLSALGLEPDCVAGHSFGELVALHAAGVYGPDELLHLARRRGELMRDAASSPGGMLAVDRSREEMVAFLVEHGHGVERAWLVNHNAPRQVVVSGDVEAIGRLERLLTADGATVRRLSASAAFHSPLVASAAGPLAESLRDVEVREPRCAVYGNAEIAPYPGDPEGIRGRLADHLSSPVWFVDQIEAMYAAGVRTFVEVGAGATLAALVGAILGDRPHAAFGLDRRGRDGVTSLHDGLGQLAVNGFRLDYGALWQDVAPADRAGTEPAGPGTVQLLGSNYGRPYPSAQDTTQQPSMSQEVPTVTLEAEAVPQTIREIQRYTAEAHSAYQQQTTDAHAAYQRLMAESHMAFLKMAESSYLAVAGGSVPVSVVHEPAVLASAPVPVPAPPAIVSAPVVIPAPVPAPVPVPDETDLEPLLISVVADKTGYPAELLDSSMDLASDLGIDSIKRVEILSELRSRAPHLPEVGTAELGALATLGQIVERLRTARPTAREHGATRARSSDGGSEDSSDGVPGGSGPAPPVPVLVRTVRRAVEAPACGPAVSGLLAHELTVVDGGSGLADHLVAALTRHDVRARAVEDLPPADSRSLILLGALASFDTPERAAEIQRDALRAARAVTDTYESGGGLFVTVQDTGGDFGLGGRAGPGAWLGGLAALARTAGREWPAATVKAIDCERAGRDPEAVAEAIARELLTGGPTREVGLRADGTRLTLAQTESPAAPASAAIPQSPDTPGPESVIAVTGGARGITAACLLELASRYQPRLVLLGRTVPAPEPEELRGLPADADLNRALAELIARRTGRAARPAEVRAEAVAVRAAREIRAAEEALAAAGAQVRYLPVDVRDADAVAAALAEVRSEWGPITGVIHGAGVIADRRIAQKTDEDYDSVFHTKVLGLRALLDATADDPLTLLCAFSSVAAWSGNVGQSDYAMANETVTQVLLAAQSARPGCVVRVIGWGPWDGGMVDRSLAEHFRLQGVPLIPVADGAAAFALEPAVSGDASVLIAARDNARIQVSDRSHPYLADHRVAGTAVLPFAMALEWFAGAAGAAARDRRSEAGSPLVALSGIDVLRKVELPALSGDGHLLTVRAAPGNLQLLGDAGALHYRATIDDPASDPEPSAAAPALATFGSPLPAVHPIYDGHVLFHGPAFQAVREVTGLSRDGAAGVLAGAGDLGWPSYEQWWTDPAVIDGGLQLAVLWAREVLGAASLPMSVGGFRLYRRGLVRGEVRCVVRAVRSADAAAVCDLEFTDLDVAAHAGAPLARMRGVTLVARPA